MLLTRLNLRQKLILAIGGLVVLSFTLIIFLIAREVYTISYQDGVTQAKKQAALHAQNISLELEQGMTVSRSLAAAALALKQTGQPDRQQLYQILPNTLASAPKLVDIFAVFEPNAFDGKDEQYRLNWPYHDPTGRIIPYFVRGKDGTPVRDNMSTPEKVNTFEQFRNNPQAYQPDYEKPGWGDFYVLTRQRRQETVIEPAEYVVGDRKMLVSSMAVPVQDAQQKILGVVGVDFALEDLQRNYNALHPFGGHITLISAAGLYVVSPKSADVGKTIAPTSVLGQHLADIKTGKAFEFDDADFLHLFMPISIGKSGQYWSVGISVPRAALSETANHVRNEAILIGSVATLAILLLVTILVSQMTVRLNHLATTMEQLNSGTGDLTIRLPITANDEIGRSGRAFNRFVESLAALVRDVRQQSQAVSSATTQLTSAAKQVEQASSQQSQAASASAAAVEEVTVAIQHIAEASQDVARLADTTGNLTDNSTQAVSKLSQEIRRLTATMQTLSDKVVSLGERSNEIDSIVHVIKDIADQTNLLALNAAIEAARAGEQGRGFAVVADEVRELAERTTTATTDISRIVNTIHHDTREAVNEVQTTRQLMENNVCVAEEANAAMSAIHRNNQELIARINDIANTTQAQSGSSHEIANNVEQISGMAQHNNHVVQEVAQAVSALQNMANNLTTIVGQFRLE